MLLHKCKKTFYLRFCQTSITWLRSLSAILSLFRRHDIANISTFAAKTWEKLWWRNDICGVFPRNWANALQTCSFSTILQWNLIFSLLTWLGTPMFQFYLLVHKTNFLWVVLSKIWMIRFFSVVNYMVRKFSFCSNFYVDVAHTLIFNTVLSIWKQFLFHKTWSWR